MFHQTARLDPAFCDAVSHFRADQRHPQANPQYRIGITMSAHDLNDDHQQIDDPHQDHHQVMHTFENVSTGQQTTEPRKEITRSMP
ncbi:Uncharacterised protein [Mycobacteroides abscessus subsp. abscessus]|nr:Uncharacterised protein [Mycobacteroides abscessus subsp. abscessus]